MVKTRIFLFSLALMVALGVLGLNSADKTYAASKSTAEKVMDKASTGPININTADLETLTKLPGIGEERAKKIIDFRKANGAFKSVDQLMEIPGIGEGIFNKIKKLITVK